MISQWINVKENISSNFFNKFFKGNIICYLRSVFRINPLSLVEILAYVIQQFQDKQEAIKFLEKTEPKVKSSNEAVALCKVLTGQILLDKLNNQEQAKKIIEEVEAMLDNADSITTVHGRFYLLASRLYRLQGKHAEYYRTALRYYYV